MPSTHKTEFLNLNQWLGADKPKREDFNRDNLNIENSVKNHVQNLKSHITEQERVQWNNAVATIGTYTGNNTATRTITLGFTPRVVILFSADRSLGEYFSSGSTTYAYSAIYTMIGSSLGIQSAANGFLVYNANDMPGGSTPKLNQNAKKYIYFAYR